jgi:hypothetical protein
MDAARKNSPDAPVALIALTAIVYVLGFAMVAAWFALVLLEPAAPKPSRSATSPCTICGVVEHVGEFDRSAFDRNGDQNESIVVLLAQLGGLKGASSSRVYETAVVHDDGTIRVVRDVSAPQWKQGDRVRVVRGRIEPLALQSPQQP